MGFAIPINVAKPIVEQIKETGEFVRPYIGITGIGLSEQTQYSSSQLEKSFGTSKGIYISSVSAGGGADAAGLAKGDIILEVDGIEVTTMNKINTIVISHRIGDIVEVKYMRSGEEYTAQVELGNNVEELTINVDDSKKN